MKNSYEILEANVDLDILTSIKKHIDEIINSANELPIVLKNTFIVECNLFEYLEDKYYFMLLNIWLNENGYMLVKYIWGFKIDVKL